jgi:hypothetical protein
MHDPEYYPSPYIVPDTQTGFDSEGNFHCVDAITPYRLALQIQEAIAAYAETSDYTVGQAERIDYATDIAMEWHNNKTLDPPDLAWQALNHWFRIYGKGVQR